MYKSERQMISKSDVKKLGKKRKTYWCAPRKVISMGNLENFNDSSDTNEKLKKKQRKKTGKVAKTRYIDVAQSGCMKNTSKYMNVIIPTQANRIGNTSHLRNQKRLAYSSKKFQIEKLVDRPKEPEEYAITSTLKDSSPIILPKKIGSRLYALVKRRLKEQKSFETAQGKSNGR